MIKGRKDGTEGKQQTINVVVRKELRDRACTQIARWFYDVDIPFNVATHDSFGIMFEANGQFGPGMKPKNIYELRVPLLNQELKTVEKDVKEHKKEWAQKGCSIFIGWMARLGCPKRHNQLYGELSKGFNICEVYGCFRCL